VEFDENMAMEHVRQLSKVIGVRAPGSPGERQGAGYIQEQLGSFGYETRLQSFPIPIYEGINTSLEVVSPGSVVYAANPMTFSASGDVEAEVVVVSNLGEPGDFPASTSGRIALIERGTIPLRDKAENARAAGAIGVIIYNNEPGNFTATANQSIDIPAVTISQEDGQALRSLAEGQTLRMTLSVKAVINQGESLNVLAKMAGTEECELLVGGHMDSVPAGPGANDNASGTAVALEIARVLAAHGDTDGVCITLFGAEEAGLLGSEYYVSQLTSAELSAMVGILNFDMLGVGDGWPMVGTQALVDLAIDSAAAIGVDAFDGDLPQGVGSDHAPFIQAGVPGILFNCFCDPNYHTAADRAEFVKADRLKVAGDIGLLMVEALLAQ
jgi:aminopeptidase YwaD